MKTDGLGNHLSQISSEFGDIDAVLLFVAILTKMKINNINIVKLKEYLYKCIEQNKYQELLNNIDLDSNLNSRCLNECYSLLKLCKILIIHDDYLYINDKNLDYNGIITEYQEYYKWHDCVFKWDNYTCIISGERNNIVAHHLYSYNKYKELRTDINNGVTISEDLHKEFHSKYGYGNNTLEQFKEFYKEKTGKDFKIN